MKKKKWLVIGLVLAVALGLIIVVPRLVSKQTSNETLTEEDPFGIEYFYVPAIDQIFVNGMVTPEESQEFHQDTTH